MPLEDNAKRRFIAKKYLGRFLLLCRVCRHEGVFAIKSLIQDLYHTNKILFFQQNSQLSQNNGLGHGTTTIFLSYSHTGSTSKKLAFLADASAKAKTHRAVSGRSNLCNFFYMYKYIFKSLKQIILKEEQNGRRKNTFNGYPCKISQNILHILLIKNILRFFYFEKKKR